jgi:hypothetical protein
MLRDVVTDEKLDLKNEDMLGVLLNRIDVEQIRPIAEKVDATSATSARIEAALGKPPAP